MESSRWTSAASACPAAVWTAAAVSSMAVAKSVFMSAIPVSDVSEQRWEAEHDDRGPHRVDRHVVGLPPLEIGQRAAPAQEADRKHGGPRQVDQQDYVHAEGGDPVGREAEL